MPVVCRLVGDVEYSEIVAFASKHADIWISNPRQMWDISKMLFDDVSLDRMKMLIDGLLEVSQGRVRGHIALVLRNSEELLAELLIDMNNERGGLAELQYFTSTGEARQWLRAMDEYPGNS